MLEFLFRNLDQFSRQCRVWRRIAQFLIFNFPRYQRISKDCNSKFTLYLENIQAKIALLFPACKRLKQMNGELVKSQDTARKLQVLLVVERERNKSPQVSREVFEYSVRKFIFVVFLKETPHILLSKDVTNSSTFSLYRIIKSLMIFRIYIM